MFWIKVFHNYGMQVRERGHLIKHTLRFSYPKIDLLRIFVSNKFQHYLHALQHRAEEGTCAPWASSTTRSRQKAEPWDWECSKQHAGSAEPWVHTVHPHCASIPCIHTVLQQESKTNNAGAWQVAAWNVVWKNVQEHKSAFAIYRNNVKTVCFNWILSTLSY